MPAVLLWNIEHSSAYQDSFSPKNSFINEVLLACRKDYAMSAVVLLEVTTQESTAQFAQNLQFQHSFHGEGSALKYAILTEAAHKSRDVTAYFPSFSDKPRGIAHVTAKGLPPLLVTHIKSDQGTSGAACLRDVCEQMRENMHGSPPDWPQTGVIALADWNLIADEASNVTRKFGGAIVAPDEPTRYPKIAANQIMQPAEGAKTLDYACVFGDLKEKKSLASFVPDFPYLRSTAALLDVYLKRVEERVASLGTSLEQNAASVLNALASNTSLVNTNAILDQQAGLENEKSGLDKAVKKISEFRERLSSRHRLDNGDRKALHQLVTQAGMGPDHLPVIVQW